MGYLVFGEWIKIQAHILLLACHETLGKLFLCASVLSSIKCGNKSSRLLGIMRRLSWKEFASRVWNSAWHTGNAIAIIISWRIGRRLFKRRGQEIWASL